MRRIGAVLLAGALAGCNQSGLSEVEIDKLRTQSLEASAEIESLSKRVAELESKYVEPTDYDEPSSAYIGDATSAGFSLGRTDFGKFAVSVQDIAAYGSGTRVQFQIMNMSAATLASAKLTVNYSRYTIDEMVEAFTKDPKARFDPSPEPVELESMLAFPPGVWVIQEITLPALKPDQVKSFSVRFDPSVVRGRTQ